mmetsp:Transcript_70297/g.135710  ORF Transcript_70297/g.135710 Transcript_70297/m.135710 type:complete len:136 (-) Transcript_70297:166-573(-)
MVARRTLLPVLAAAVSALCLYRLASIQTFAGVQGTPGRRPQVSTRVSDITEIVVTCPSVGARTRMVVQPDTTVDAIVTRARKSLGFDQSFLNDSDFKVYAKKDESTPISGKIGDHGLVPWGPDGMELHIYFDPPL